MIINLASEKVGNVAEKCIGLFDALIKSGCTPLEILQGTLLALSVFMADKNKQEKKRRTYRSHTTQQKKDVGNDTKS
jgi:hypothetical protein